MRKRLFFWELGGFLFASGAGTLLHYVYDWTGGNSVVAVLSAVNESTWEHMKLLFVPMFLFSITQLCIMGRNYLNFLAARAASTLAGLTAIPVLFYTYIGTLGRQIMWVNISIFYAAAFLAFALDWWLLRRGSLSSLWQQLAGLLLLWLLAFLFVWFTFHPPLLGLWQDPITGLYGTLQS